MRLALLILLTMSAFASNSLLNRVAVDSGAISAPLFALIRVGAGAVTLAGSAVCQRRPLSFSGGWRATGAVGLALYMVGFSLAYIHLDAGLGALVLFGVVQIALFGAASINGAGASLRQIISTCVAFGGLVLLLWPTETAPVQPWAVCAMVFAALGWSVYTLAGRQERDILAGSAANFILATPLVFAPALVVGFGQSPAALGIVLALVSGAVTSGLGYALWYWILPQITATFAATVQLSAPVLALIGGVLLLGEPLTVRLALGAAIVVGGIAWALPRKGT